MQDIEIVYRSWFRERRVKTTFPSMWSELNARQFTALYKRRDDVSLLSLMLQIPKRVVKRLSLLQIYELAGLFDFIKRDTKVSGFVLEKISVRGAGVLYAPQSRLAEMSFMQFIYADSYYMQYAERLGREALCSLVAHLYSPADGYDKKAAERNADRLKRLDINNLEAIALNYGLVRKWVADRYPLVFPVTDRRKTETKGSWSDVFDNLVGDDLKDRDKYAEVPVNAVFKYMTKKMKEAKKNATKV